MWPVLDVMFQLNMMLAAEIYDWYFMLAAEISIICNDFFLFKQTTQDDFSHPRNDVNEYHQVKKKQIIITDKSV